VRLASPVGAGVSELRIPLGPGCRVHFVQPGERVVVLLAGSDKSTQRHDFRIAKEPAREL
jgi:putative addiction module killer protein